MAKEEISYCTYGRERFIKSEGKEKPAARGSAPPEGWGVTKWKGT